MTNAEFAERIGVVESMASRLRNGTRLPSTRTLIRIIDAFGLDSDDALAAFHAGREEFAAYLRKEIWGEPSNNAA